VPNHEVSASPAFDAVGQRFQRFRIVTPDRDIEALCERRRCVPRAPIVRAPDPIETGVGQQARQGLRTRHAGGRQRRVLAFVHLLGMPDQEHNGLVACGEILAVQAHRRDHGDCGKEPGEQAHGAFHRVAHRH
jgi:hypothetical protein